MSAPTSFAGLSDLELIAAVKRLAAEEREATAALVASLIEVDARRLFRGEGCSSLFDYCTRVLRLSESAAYARIAVARAARRFPLALEQLERGDITLTTICLLAAHLNEENHQALLDSARHATKRQVEELIARLRPQPDVPATIRRLPSARVADSVTQVGAPTSDPMQPRAEAVANTPATDAADRAATAGATAASPILESASCAGASLAVKRPGVIAPLAPERYKVQFTVGRETHDKLRRVQDLMRHSVPDGDAAAIFDRALTLLVEHLERTKLGYAKRTRPSAGVANGSRHVPSAVKRAVWDRDGGCCAFSGREGRCSERGFLEFHHVVPYARGGRATGDNIQLRCRAHNQYEAEEAFGRRGLLVREPRPAYGFQVMA